MEQIDPAPDVESRAKGNENKKCSENTMKQALLKASVTLVSVVPMLTEESVAKMKLALEEQVADEGLFPRHSQEVNPFLFRQTLTRI